MSLTMEEERSRKWKHFPQLAALLARMPAPDRWQRPSSASDTPEDQARQFQEVISVVLENKQMLREEMLGAERARETGLHRRIEQDLRKLMEGCKHFADFYRSEADRLEKIAREIDQLCSW